VISFLFELVERYFSDYLRVEMGDDILILMFCQEYLIVIGFETYRKKFKKCCFVVT